MNRFGQAQWIGFVCRERNMHGPRSVWYLGRAKRLAKRKS